MECVVNGLTEIQNGTPRFAAESTHRLDSATSDSIDPSRFAVTPRKNYSICGGYKPLKLIYFHRCRLSASWLFNVG